jgi:hypothetical protein
MHSFVITVYLSLPRLADFAKPYRLGGWPPNISGVIGRRRAPPAAVAASWLG